MTKRVLFGVVGLILAIQVCNVNCEDPKLEQCKKKFLQQAKSIDFSHLPACFDASKLAEAKNHTQIFGEFFDSLPEDCKKPFAGNVGDCLKFGFSYFKNHTQEVQAGIVGSINALFEGAKNCIDTAVKRFSNLDEYIAKGCPDS